MLLNLADEVGEELPSLRLIRRGGIRIAQGAAVDANGADHAARLWRAVAGKINAASVFWHVDVVVRARPVIGGMAPDRVGPDASLRKACRRIVLKQAGTGNTRLGA